MAVNKVTVNGETIVDLTGDTVTPASLAQGVTAHDAAGNPISGTMLTFWDVQGAGAHNSLFRGKNLGSSVTAAQWAAIEAGTFEDLYIGDYWAINGVTWRIAAFDYYLHTGDNPVCTTHHAVIVPDAPLYETYMNPDKTVAGAYVGSAMRTTGLNQAKTIINNAFGAAHILAHTQYLANAANGDNTSGGAFYNDSTVELMTERNVYGSAVFNNSAPGTTVWSIYTIDKSQYPLFRYRPDMASNGYWLWLRDVGYSEGFCGVNNMGNAAIDTSWTAHGVRPAFSIKA